MFKRFIKIFLLLSLILAADKPAFAVELKSGEFITLCYHSITLKPDSKDIHNISQKNFVEQMEYLRTHEYHPVSLDDILQASEGKKKLPPKAVLLTFDDAYLSYYTFVLPMLERYEFPSVLGVVGSFIETSLPNMPEPLMSWEQIKEVRGNKLVEVVSHTYDMHKGIKYNPQGNEGPAARVALYDDVTKSYETELNYRLRLAADFRRQNDLFMEKLGFVPRGVIWPYGKFSRTGLDEAMTAGCRVTWSLEEGVSSVNDLSAVKRLIIQNRPISWFVRLLGNFGQDFNGIRAVQVDLDLIYNESEKETEENLGKLIDRLVKMKVNTVFLQAFADPKGDGNIKSVYFRNRQLPVRADIFSHAVHQMYIREIKVFAWMPTLSIEFPDSEFNEKYRVRESKDGEIVPSSSWYNRLTPFSEEVRERVRTMYEDLAASSQIHGVLFQDDAYLNDCEDFHPLAREAYLKVYGQSINKKEIEEDERLAKKWAGFKSMALVDFTRTLMDTVKSRYPEILFARNLYAPVLLDRESEVDFAQNFSLYLENYDYAVVMAYPQMEEADAELEWLENMVSETKKYPGAIAKTVFKVQAYDWEEDECVDDDLIHRELRKLLASGARHIGYYPDNLWEDKPELDTIKLEMSNKVYPY